MVPTFARQTDVAPRASYQAYDEYRSAATRPTSRSAAAAMATAISHRRGVMSDAHALLAKPTFHLAADGRETLLRLGFVARHDHRLRVRCADQAPAIAEQDTDAIDVDDLVLRLEMLHGLVDEGELLLFVDVDPDLRGRDEVGDVGERLL